METPKTWIKTIAVLVLAALSLGLLVSLGPRVSAESVVEGFSSKQQLTPGQVVALDKTASRSVKVAPANDLSQMYGVVVDPSDAPITVVGQDSKFFVATSGTYQVLVNAAQAPIKPGDYISMSTIDGIAAKATSSQEVILGKAVSGFNGKDNVITNSNGAAIGRIYVKVGIQKNPIASADPTLPSFLRKAANGVANKSVPVVRVYSALLIFMLSILASITILWSGVRGSLISLGRNPLSRHAIFSGMYKVVFTGLGVFIIGMAGVYLLLKA